MSGHIFCVVAGIRDRIGFGVDLVVVDFCIKENCVFFYLNLFSSIR